MPALHSLPVQPPCPFRGTLGHFRHQVLKGQSSASVADPSDGVLKVTVPSHLEGYLAWGKGGEGQSPTHSHEDQRVQEVSGSPQNREPNVGDTDSPFPQVSQELS